MTSQDTYEEVVRTVHGWPAWAHAAIEIFTEAGLVVLALVLGVVALRRRDPRAVAWAGAGIIATIGAYAASALLKTIEAQPRPCSAIPGLDTIAACPPSGDWSLPSNHAAIAAGLAVAVTVLAPRLAPLAGAIALAVAASRVAVGVHYPHDVVTGLSLGAGVAALLLVALRPAVPAAAMLLHRAARRLTVV